MKSEEKWQKTLILDVDVIQPPMHTFIIISTLLYSLTVEQFLMHLFFMCAPLCLAIVSKIDKIKYYNSTIAG